MNTIEEIIQDIRDGRMVILMDDEDRENEGDLIMAASWVRPEDINFMARYGRGLVCLTLTPERCEQLRLPLMVSDTNAKHATNFTVSIEAARGVTTGISAADRATTVKAAVASDAKPSDIVQPGHIFPIMAQPGGVLSRAGHTEAGCDLARLAGLEPASVIVEILNEDGTMARRGELEQFAAQHQLKIGTVADLIRYRMQHEKTVERVAECNLTTEYGRCRLLAYEDVTGKGLHFALLFGNPDPDTPTLVRVHLHDSLCDVFGTAGFPCSLPLSSAVQRVAQEQSGIIVFLRLPEDAKTLAHRINELALKEQGIVLPKPSRTADLRSYGVGARIIADLAVKKMRVLGAPKKFHALQGFGLEVVEYVDCE